MLYLVTGPPAAGKSTWVRQNAKLGDITIDYDAIAAVLTPLKPGDRLLPSHISMVTKAARKAAIDLAIEYRHKVDVYVIHSMPSERMVSFYERLGASVITIDPGEHVVMGRCKAERPWQVTQAAKKWYQSRKNGRDDRINRVVQSDSVSMQW